MPRIDAYVKVTGQAQFVRDLNVPGMLHTRILRSTFAHAHIVKIDTSRAESLPGVAAILTHKNIPAGWLAFGQKVYVFPGCFTIEYDLEVSGCPSNKSAAAVDIAIDGGRKILTGGEITGQTLTLPEGVVLEFTADDFCIVEPRVFYNGNGDIFLRAIHIREAGK